MTARELVDTLRARGIELITDGQRLGVRPAGVLTDAERVALQQHRGDVLALLRPDPSSPQTPSLNAQALREALGPHPDPHDLAILKLDVHQAVAQLQRESQAGAIGQTPLLVRGRPLGDWLDLDTIAGLLKLGQRR